MRGEDGDEDGDEDDGITGIMDTIGMKLMKLNNWDHEYYY